MKFPPNVIDQLKARLNIVEEVRKVVPDMKKKGRAWWGRCPFHTEKSGSFHVREDQNSYYCFGCGAGGDVITFVQETQGGTFSEVVTRLARQAGIKLPESEPSDPAASQRRTDGYKALERASIYFQRSIGEDAQAYINRRALTPATVEEFGLGYAPDTWDSLKNALITEGFTPEVIKATGLTTQSEKSAQNNSGQNRDYDRFRGRLMFPIHDSQGRTVGFGGRVMGKGEPKYLNSPETPFFNKSFLLYNLHRAKPHLKTAGQLVLVEGYMDVIALYQAGFKTAVAPLGTAVTAEQITLLWQQNPNPIVCLDGDAAGRTAALRMANRALGVLDPGRTLSFVFLPQGEDPDTLVNKDGIGTFRNLLTQTTPLETLLWQQLASNADPATADGRASLEAELAQLLAQITNQTVRRAYSQILRDKLFQATRTTRAPGSYTKGPKPSDTQAPLDYKPGIQGDAATRTLLALICRWPHILPHVDETLGSLTFPAGPLGELSQAVLRAYVTLRQSPEELAQDLQNGPHSSIVTDLLTSTGVMTLPEETDALPLFHEQHSLWQSQTAHREKYTSMLKKADWLSPEAWNNFKELREASASKK